jgi:hypothetical protein
VDNYRTPHTDKIHVVERFKLIEGGKIPQSTVTVEGPGTFNMAGRVFSAGAKAIASWKRIRARRTTPTSSAVGKRSATPEGRWRSAGTSSPAAR